MAKRHSKTRLTKRDRTIRDTITSKGRPPRTMMIADNVIRQLGHDPNDFPEIVPHVRLVTRVRDDL